MRKPKRFSWEIKEGPPCLSCGGRQFAPLSTALDFDDGTESFSLMICEKCRLVRTEPLLSDVQLQKYYSLPYYGGGKAKFKGLAERLSYWINYRRAGAISSFLRKKGRGDETGHARILDIGCGRGNLLRIFQGKGYECYGVERAEFPVDHFSEGIFFYQGELSDIGFKENFFDAVILWHVLEHIENPIAILAEIARIIQPGGLLIIAVPNFGSIQSNLFRAHWFHLDLPRHTYHFTHDTLSQALKDQGFKGIYKNTFSIEQNVFGFIQSFFNKMFPRVKPNRFYSLLKKNNTPFSIPEFFIWAGLTSILFPLALLETLISGLLGKGATLIVRAEKSLVD